ncbi:MAG TPA: ABC transporter substrate-binding protein [Terriglobales bacterium]|jgi:MarR-like DNA-binding transcriptional regulator SgrR of sgrS sRNA
MKRTSLLWLAINSLALASLAVASLTITTVARAATRPHYGGVLRLAIAGPVSSLDPADASNVSGQTAIQHIAPLLFNTLTTLDDRGEAQPSLALAWKSDFSSQHWEFQLRPGIAFSDGTPLTANAVAASLRVANPRWNISPAGDSVIIESDSAARELPAELALSRNSVVLREGGKLIGTGPFTLAQWEPGKNLALSAREDYWARRPFVDSVEIAIGRSPRDQMLSLELGRLDGVELAAEQASGTVAGGRVVNSAPDELLTIVFSRDAHSPEDRRLRQALGLAIDRSLLNTVVLHSSGEPAGGLLPNWMTGYEFLFSTSPDSQRARQIHEGINQSSAWNLGYDQTDPSARVIAERIALNAQDAGINIKPNPAASPDAQLVRIRLVSRDAHVALNHLAISLQLPAPDPHRASSQSTSSQSLSTADLYAAENALLQTERAIPLLHLRTAVALARNVHGWSEAQDGRWDLPNVWLSAEKPSTEKP